MMHFKKYLHSTLRLLVVMGLFTATGTQAADKIETTISGFVDVQGEWIDSRQSRNIYVNDGALYFGASHGHTSLFIDLPFAWSGAANNNFSFATGKSQAYIKHSFSDNIALQFGQFDKIYGFELNDSIGLKLARHGILFNNAIPNTHTGLMFAYERGNWGLNLLFASDSNTGGLTAVNSKPEFGARFHAGFSGVDLMVGWLAQPIQIGSGSTHLIDFVAGTDLGDKIRLDVQFDLVSTTNLDTGIGFLIQPVFMASEMIDITLRGELLSKIGGNNSQFQISAGPQFKVSKAFLVKFDYTFQSTTAVSGGNSVSDHMLYLSGLFSM